MSDVNLQNSICNNYNAVVTNNHSAEKISINYLLNGLTCSEELDEKDL